MSEVLTREKRDPVAEAMSAGQFGPSALKRRAREVREHYDRVAADRARYIADNTYYYDQVCRQLRAIIQPGKRVLQVGCLTPDFLDTVEPSFGVGIDVSEKLVAVAAQRFPKFHFHLHEDYRVPADEPFDYVVIMDVNDQVDPVAALRALRPVMNERTRVVIHHYNHLWESLVRATERLGAKFPLPQQNWLSPMDLRDILLLCDFERLQVHRAVLAPKYVPLLSPLLN
jgi:hypothetical protein